MKSYKDATGKRDVGFSDRLTTSSAAKKNELERYRTSLVTDDPAFAERQVARHAASAARDARTAERKAARLAVAAREAAEKVARVANEAREAQEKATQFASEQADAEARAIALAVQQKANRDARYAARKVRK
ncbi:DUF6481 family protein [Telmatospirillum sp.]|uniref:DUF6481 family protein n=1 Tax=Telmatospirillum sp. TaxID=2079197 RepID=UPI0028514B5B|nr:DUF6481 family protein [Telmatospirillum sp.]MDR3435468.1 DUF6481 family protein [Telmatospirillum sp.]